MNENCLLNSDATNQVIGPMKKSMNVNLLVYIYLSRFLSVEGFVLERQPNLNIKTFSNRRIDCAQLHSSNASSERPKDTKLNFERHSRLQFKASMMYQSDLVPFEHSQQVTRFFDTTESNFHLLAKGTRNSVAEINNQTLVSHLSHWRIEARNMGAEQPNSNDKLLSVSVNTPFLVFVLRVQAMIGVKLLWHSHKSPTSKNEKVLLPEYQFTLLDQKFTADGPPPLVFIFNQLTGIQKTAKGTYTQPNHALFTVIAKPSADFKSISFISRMTAELNIRFPEILLQLLPVPKERIEKEGSISLKRNMERDIPPSVDLFTKAYVDFFREIDKD